MSRLAGSYLTFMAAAGSAIVPVSALEVRNVFIGTVLDPRVMTCGVDLHEGAFSRLVPFLDASGDLTGRFRLRITKWTAGNMGATSQESRIEKGRLGSASMVFDRSDRVRLDLSMWDEAGKPICRLEQQIDFEPPVRKI